MASYINYLRSLVPDSSSSSGTSVSSRESKRSPDVEIDTPPRKKLRKQNLDGGADENSIEINDSNNRNQASPPFQQGTNIYSDQNVQINVQAVEHQRHTRFRAEDHLYQVKIHPKRRTSPILLSLETALKEALMAILMTLQNNYSQTAHHQIYITIIESKIKHGLNTGNYDLAAPPTHIVNRALTILHSYLKSNQTMKLSDSFKVQIKVLSHGHTQHLETTNPRFTKKIFRDYKRIRN